ncbi:MAG: hypothetical protein FWC79_03880 [Oscillospiraceae bacterium]|nr:hypothetical protein [Oscillospiraceae bacterium]
MNTFHFIAMLGIAMCIGLIYLMDKKEKSKIERGMRESSRSDSSSNVTNCEFTSFSGLI